VSQQGTPGGGAAQHLIPARVAAGEAGRCRTWRSRDDSSGDAADGNGWGLEESDEGWLPQGGDMGC
jgi:hypothetical protein